MARALTYISQNMKLTKVGILHDSNAFGSSGAAEIVKTAGSYGLSVVANESYDTTDTDLTAQLTKIRAADPQVLVVWGTNPGPAIAAKDLKQLGMSIPFVGSHGIADKTFIQLAGPAAEGMVFPACNIIVPSSITDPAQKTVCDAFISAFAAPTVRPPTPSPATRSTR